ncbi:MAG: hypothetical protein B7X64_11520 [Halothiobacillus sp. 39-53-45]|nr:MAG: hypothetical protein B7X64_11520 [Halothiobacillus sp. 39-53-45]
MCYAKLAKPAELLIQKPQNEAEVAGRSYSTNPRVAAHIDRQGAATRMGRAFEGDPLCCGTHLTNGITIRFAPRLAAHPSKARLGHKGFDQRFLSTPPNKSRPVQIPKQIPKQKA